MLEGADKMAPLVKGVWLKLEDLSSDLQYIHEKVPWWHMPIGVLGKWRQEDSLELTGHLLLLNLASYRFTKTLSQNVRDNGQ